MAVESSASATWEGELAKGSGTVRVASGAFAEQALTWHARAESRESGTSPEELIAAAHAGCFAMALSSGLGAEAFRQAAEGAKANCPVSQALAGVREITLDAALEG